VNAASISAPGIGRRASPESRLVTSVARAGLSAQAIVYLALAWLTAQIAAGHSSPQANQKGALAEMVSHSGGVVLVTALAVGFASYAVWRLSEAVFGSSVNHKPLDRLVSLARALAYGALCITTFLFLAGHRGQSDGQQQATWTARIMRHTGGQVAVALGGAILVIIGVAMLVEAAVRRFERQLDRRAVPAKVRAIVDGLGLYGSLARALIVVLIGALIIDAAVTVNPQQSTGLDGALKALAGTALGPVLLGLMALGFLAFALYVAATARWIKT
jgi:Domain of Unknown Function (DUF1206)